MLGQVMSLLSWLGQDTTGYVRLGQFGQVSSVYDRLGNVSTG